MSLFPIYASDKIQAADSTLSVNRLSVFLQPFHRFPIGERQSAYLAGALHLDLPVLRFDAPVANVDRTPQQMTPKDLKEIDPGRAISAGCHQPTRYERADFVVEREQGIRNAQ